MRDNILKLPQILPGATEECIGVPCRVRGSRANNRPLSSSNRSWVSRRVTHAPYKAVPRCSWFAPTRRPVRRSLGEAGYADTFFSPAASAADPVITEAQLFHCDRVEQIPAVKNYRGVHKLAYLFQIDSLEFLPFCS